MQRYRVPYGRRSESFLADRRCKSVSPLTASIRQISCCPEQCVRLSQQTGLRNITHPATLMKATALAPPRTVLRSHLLGSHHQTGTKAQGVPADCGGSMRGTHRYACLAILTRKSIESSQPGRPAAAHRVRMEAHPAHRQTQEERAQRPISLLHARSTGPHLLCSDQR